MNATAIISFFTRNDVSSIIQKDGKHEVDETLQQLEHFLDAEGKASAEESSDCVEIETAVLAIANHLKSITPKLLVLEHLVVPIRYVLICLRIVNRLLEEAPSKLHKRWNKRHLESLIQACYVLLTHFLPSILKRTILTDSQVANISELKESLYCSLLQFIHNFFLLDNNFFWTNVQLFFNESFKIDRIIENTVNAIHQTLFIDSKPIHHSDPPISAVSCIKALLDEVPRFQCFLFFCLFQPSPKVLRQTLALFSDVFTLDPNFLKKWTVSFSASTSSLGGKILKILAKVVQAMKIILFIHPYHHSEENETLDTTHPFFAAVSTIHANVLQFFSKLIRSLPINTQTNPPLPVNLLHPLKEDLPLIESQLSRLFEVITFNCFTVSVPHQLQSFNRKKGYNLNNSNDFSSYISQLSPVAEESLKWLLQWTKTLSNNHNRHYQPYIARALKSVVRPSCLPPNLQSLLPQEKKLSLSDGNYSILIVWNKIAYFSFEKKWKFSSQWSQINSFFIHHYLPIYLPASPHHPFPSSDTNLSFLRTISTLVSSSACEGELDLFLQYVQAILQWEQRGGEILSLRSSSSYQPLSLLSLLHVIVNQYFSSLSHSLRHEACRTLGNFQSFHWRLLLTDAQRSFSIVPVIQQLLNLAGDPVGNVRSSAFRCLGETIAIVIPMLSDLSPSSLNSIWIDGMQKCENGCSDSKLAVRIQAAFALNKYLVQFSTIQATLKATHNFSSLSRLYSVYENLLKDSEKIETTAILGLGYLVAIDEMISLDLDIEVRRKRWIMMLKGTIFPRLGMPEPVVGEESVTSFVMDAPWFESLNSNKKLLCASCQTASYIVYRLLLSIREENFVSETTTEVFTVVAESVRIFLHFLHFSHYLQLIAVVMKSLTSWVSIINELPAHLAPTQWKLKTLLEILSSLFFLTQQHPYLIKDTSVKNGKIASTIKKSSSFNLQDDSDDGEEKGLVNLFVHRKHCVRLFLLQCLFQIVVQSNVFGLSDEFPTRPLVLQNLDPIICLLETALAEASFALSEFFISENPPIIPLMDSFFGNSTLPKTAQIALSEIASSLIRFVEQDSYRVVKDEEISSVLMFRLRSIERIYPLNLSTDSSTRYNRFDGLLTDPNSIIASSSVEILPNNSDPKVPQIPTEEEIEEF